jgi:hypothetical protein
VFGWNNETTLKSFGRLSKERPRQGEREAKDPPIQPPERTRGDEPHDQNETAIAVHPLDA